MENNLKLDELQLQKMSSKILSITTNKKITSTQSLAKIEDPAKKKYKRKAKQLTTEQIEVFRQAF